MPWLPVDPEDFGGFDPDTPIDYLTMTDQTTGDTVIAAIENGAWVLTAVQRRVTEDGNVRVTEDGNVRITEG
jgi:hypothetical protein